MTSFNEGRWGERFGYLSSSLVRILDEINLGTSLQKKEEVQFQSLHRSKSVWLTRFTALRYIGVGGESMIFQSWFTSDCLTALRVRYAQIGEFQSVCMGEFGCEFFFLWWCIFFDWIYGTVQRVAWFEVCIYWIFITQLGAALDLFLTEIFFAQLDLQSLSNRHYFLLQVLSNRRKFIAPLSGSILTHQTPNYVAHGSTNTWLSVREGGKCTKIGVIGNVVRVCRTWKGKIFTLNRTPPPYVH